MTKTYTYRIFLKNDKVNGINHGYDVYVENLKSALSILECSRNKVLSYYKFED